MKHLHEDLSERMLKIRSCLNKHEDGSSGFGVRIVYEVIVEMFSGIVAGLLFAMLLRRVFNAHVLIIVACIVFGAIAGLYAAIRYAMKQ